MIFRYPSIIHEKNLVEPKEWRTSSARSRVHGWQRAPLAPNIATIAAGSFKHRNPADIQGAGYVVPALEAALWAFYRSDDFTTGALLAANLGRDADTTAAIYGQLAGAYYSVEGIPADWRSKLTHLDTLTQFANQLLKLSTQSPH